MQMLLLLMHPRLSHLHALLIPLARSMHPVVPGERCLIEQSLVQGKLGAKDQLTANSIITPTLFFAPQAPPLLIQVDAKAFASHSLFSTIPAPSPPALMLAHVQIVTKTQCGRRGHAHSVTTGATFGRLREL